jgi:hypothetical protein
VLLYAGQYGKPRDLVGSLTGLTGRPLPGAANALRRRPLERNAAKRAKPVRGVGQRRRRRLQLTYTSGINSTPRRRCGRRDPRRHHQGIGHNPKLGSTSSSRTWQPLHLLPARPRLKVYPVPAAQAVGRRPEIVGPKKDEAPSQPPHVASRWPPSRVAARRALPPTSTPRPPRRRPRVASSTRRRRRTPRNLRQRLLPSRGAHSVDRAGIRASSIICCRRSSPALDLQVLLRRGPLQSPARWSCGRSWALAGRCRYRDPRLRETDKLAPHLNFSIRPAGRGHPKATRSRSSTAGSCSSRLRSTGLRARTRSPATSASAACC